MDLTNHDLRVLRIQRETLYLPSLSPYDQELVKKFKYMMSSKIDVTSKSTINSYEIYSIVYVVVEKLRRYLHEQDHVSNWTYKIFDHVNSNFCHHHDDQNSFYHNGWVERDGLNGSFELWLLFEDEQSYSLFEEFFVQFILSEGK